MSRFALILALFLSTPLAAQEVGPPDLSEPEEDGLSLIERGARLFLRGLMNEMEPALDEMGRALSEMEPAIRDLQALVDDIRNYEAPRILDNGDIVIPRRKDAPPPRILKPAPVQPDGEIEL